MPDTTKAVNVILPATNLNIGSTLQASADIITNVPDSQLDTKPVVWSSSAPSIATVDTNGLIRGVSAGTAMIRAAVGTVIGSTPVTVNTLPFVDIDAAGQATIEALAVGASFILKGPTISYPAQKQP